MYGTGLYPCSGPRAHLLALKVLAEPNVRGRTYNVGCGGEGYTVREVIDIAEHVTGKSIPVKVGPRRPGDPAVLVASSDRIARELEWRPVLQDLRLMVQSAWSWMQNATGSARSD